MADDGLKFWQRLTIVTVSATVGFAAMLWYLISREEGERVRGEGFTMKPGAERGFTLVPTKQRTEIEPAKPRAVEVKEAPLPEKSGAVPLEVKAMPRTFKRSQDGTIQATSVPGATCTMSAKYSTGRAPTGIDEETLTCDEDGVCAWTWRIGTSGDHVTVIVNASAKEHTDTEVTKRVKITD